MLQRLLSTTALSVALTAAPTAFGAALIIDQNQPSATTLIAHFSQTGLAQSFQQSQSNIAGAGIFLARTGSSSPITISLWDALVGGASLASGSALGTPGDWVDVFWTPVNVVPDHTYFLTFEPFTNDLVVAGDTEDPYSRGQAYANKGFGSFPKLDYSFRTFYAPNATTRSEVPEPGVLGLVAVSMLAFFRATRSRSNA